MTHGIASDSYDIDLTHADPVKLTHGINFVDFYTCEKGLLTPG